MNISEDLVGTLKYLFEHYSHKEIFAGENITLEMLKAGYSPENIKIALDWLTESKNSTSKKPKKTVRIYSPEEEYKITPEARIYLTYLNNLHIIDSNIRELIIHSALSLNTPRVDIEQIQLISLAVLHKHPNKFLPLHLLEHLFSYGKKEVTKH